MKFGIHHEKKYIAHSSGHQDVNTEEGDHQEIALVILKEIWYDMIE